MTSVSIVYTTIIISNAYLFVINGDGGIKSTFDMLVDGINLFGRIFRLPLDIIILQVFLRVFNFFIKKKK